MKVEIATAQGIGDIFWVYQKFAPYVDGITFLVMEIPGAQRAISSRAEAFLRLLPKVDDVMQQRVSAREYDALARQDFSMESVLRNGKGVYLCNAALERGVRLEDIDRELPVQWSVPIRDEACDLPPLYVTLYVSGGTLNNSRAWNVEQWVELVQAYYARALPLPLVLLGAEYDRAVLEMIRDKLDLLLIRSHLFIGLPAAQVVYTLRKSSFLLGYQSGLGVLADNLDVPQLMVYYEFLARMRYAWCKPLHLRERQIFHAGLFSQSPGEVLNGAGL